MTEISFLRCLRPIATAPKDGRRVGLVYVSDDPFESFGGAAFWRDGQWVSQFKLWRWDKQPTHWYPMKPPTRKVRRAKRKPPGEQ